MEATPRAKDSRVFGRETRGMGGMYRAWEWVSTRGKATGDGQPATGNRSMPQRRRSATSLRHCWSPVASCLSPVVLRSVERPQIGQARGPFEVAEPPREEP